MDLYKVRKELNLGIPLSSMKLRVTDYARVSTDHIEQKSSLKNQIEHFDDMINNNPNWIYISGYVDDGISGTTDFKRESFMQMIDDAKCGKFDLIVTKEISRFSRNTLDSIKYTRELLNYGVAVLFVNDNINTAMPDAELRLTIMASMAQDEIRRLSERVKFGMNRSIKNGTILGNDTLYGYKKKKEKGNLEIIEEEGIIVKKIFNLYVHDNCSLSKIAKILNNENIKTSHNKKWSTTTLSRMIKNPKYKGFYCGKKSEIINYMTKKVKKLSQNDWIVYEDKKRIPPLVDDKLWEKANSKLKMRNIKFGDDFKKNKLIYQNRYPLSAKIYCKNDNQVFHRRMQLKSTDDISWVCSKHLREGKNECNSPILRESEIYNILKKIFKYLNIDLSNVFNILIDLYQKSSKEMDKLNIIKILQNQKEKLLLKKEKLLNLTIDNNLSNEEFCKLNNECNDKINKIEQKLSCFNKKNEQIKITKEKDFKKIIKDCLEKKNITDKIIELLLDKVIVQRINDYSIKLDIYLGISSNNKYTQILQDDYYEFKRGYNVINTKSYIIKYYVNAYYNDKL